MSVNLSDRFYDKQYQSGVKPNVSTGSTSTAQEQIHHNGAVRQMMQAGQQFRGTVVSVDGEKVVIRLQDEQLFQAHLENGIHLAKGMSLSFEVKGVQNGQISLMPLYSNLDQSLSVSKALDAAGLPITERSIEMVHAMMEQGMSIDTKSLQGMYQPVSKFNMAEPSSVVWLKQLKVPVTGENLEQFENYRNHSAQMLDSYKEIGTQIVTVMEEISAEGDLQKLGRLFTEVMRAVTESGMNQDSANSMALPEMENGLSQAVYGQENSLTATVPGEGNILSETAPGEESVLSAAVTGEEISVSPMPADAKTIFTDMETEDAALSVVIGKKGDTIQTEITGPEEKHTDSTGTMHETVMSEAEAPSDETVKDSFRKLMDQMLLKTAGHVQKTEEFYYETGKTLAHLMGTPEFEDLFQESLSGKWLLKPEDDIHKDKVKEVYRKVLEQTAGLKEALSNVGKEDSVAMKSVQNLSRNVEFLNELNQNFSLLQLPLKMSEQKAHGDLYVYTNKKNMTSDKGAVTALLHLEMDHVGDMDIYVAMQSQKVSTKFYLESDDMISFFEEHMDELDHRLAQKGYALHSELLQKDRGDAGNVFEQMLKDSRIQGRTPAAAVYRQSFDMRA